MAMLNYQRVSWNKVHLDRELPSISALARTAIVKTASAACASQALLGLHNTLLPDLPEIELHKAGRHGAASGRNAPGLVSHASSTDVRCATWTACVVRCVLPSDWEEYSHPRQIILYLVGGLEHNFYCSIFGNVIIPMDELIFFREVQSPPTRSIDYP